MLQPQFALLHGIMGTPIKSKTADPASPLTNGRGSGKGKGGTDSGEDGGSSGTGSGDSDGNDLRGSATSDVNAAKWDVDEGFAPEEVRRRYRLSDAVNPTTYAFLTYAL